MLKFIAALSAFLQFFFTSIGLFAYDSNVSYGGNPYIGTEVKEWVKVIDSGVSDYVIVVADKAEPAELTAANELSDYLYQISGVKLEIVTDATPAAEKEIVVGKTWRERRVTNIDRDALGTDGFVLRTVGEKIFIAGGAPRGTLYGVYTFLEEQLGCRWYNPSLEYVPQTELVEVNAKLNDIQTPSFEYRRNAPSGTTVKDYAQSKINFTYWTNNITYGGAETYVIWDVTMDKLVPDALFAEHPEYFAYLPETGERSVAHVCMTNPDILAIAVENAKTYIKANTTGANHIHIGQKDNSSYCECENCLAVYESYGSVSAPTIKFANAFQEALAKDGYEDFIVTFYAYNETRRVPTDITLKCNDSVVPVICGSHQACHCHPYYECREEDEEFSFIDRFTDDDYAFCDDLEGWVKIAKRTYIYEYTINFLNTPQFFANFATIQPNAKWMRDLGVTGITYNCGDGHYAAFNELRNYILQKVQWNVDCDVEYHMKDFANAWYGEEAAPFILEYITRSTAKIAAVSHAFDFDWHYQTAYFDTTEVEEIDALWEQALSATATDKQRYQIEKEWLGWRYYKANLFLDEFNPLNPSRGVENEKLYDDFIAHGILSATSVGGSFPAKEEINFLLGRPIDWR